MAKQLRKDAITQQNLADYAKTEQDDFLLEMKAVRMCRQQSYEVSHGGTYEDPVTGKTRQSDVRAILGDDQRMIFLAIECKSIDPSFPLLISTTRAQRKRPFTNWW